MQLATVLPYVFEELTNLAEKTMSWATLWLLLHLAQAKSKDGAMSEVK